MFYDHAASCRGKTQYVTPAEAHQVLGRRAKGKRNGKKDGRGGLQVYCCKRCKYWHLGSDSIG